MTTTAPVAKGQAVAAATSQQPPAGQPIKLPSILGEEKRLDGFRDPMWVMRPLSGKEPVELQQALVALEARQRTATVNAIRFHIGKMLNHWDDRKSDEEKGWIIADWERLLKGFAEAHIIEACDTWLLRERFKPKVADIVDLIELYQIRDRESIRRSRVLLGMQPPRTWERLPAPEEMIVTDPARVAQMMEKVGHRLTAPAARKPKTAPPANRPSATAVMDSRDPEAVERLRKMRKPEPKADHV